MEIRDVEGAVLGALGDGGKVHQDIRRRVWKDDDERKRWKPYLSAVLQELQRKGWIHNEWVGERERAWCITADGRTVLKTSFPQPPKAEPGKSWRHYSWQARKQIADALRQAGTRIEATESLREMLSIVRSMQDHCLGRILHAMEMGGVHEG